MFKKLLCWLFLLLLPSCELYKRTTYHDGFECVDNKGCDVYKNKKGTKFYRCHEGLTCGVVK